LVCSDVFTEKIYDKFFRGNTPNNPVGRSQAFGVIKAYCWNYRSCTLEMEAVCSFEMKTLI